MLSKAGPLPSTPPKSWIWFRTQDIDTMPVETLRYRLRLLANDDDCALRFFTEDENANVAHIPLYDADGVECGYLTYSDEAADALRVFRREHPELKGRALSEAFEGSDAFKGIYPDC